jgi:hypothetical protein
LTIFTRIKQMLADPLATFRIFERTIAVVCITIPALLRLADKGNTGFRFRPLTVAGRRVGW